MDEDKHPGGRPKITLADLPANWEELILNEMRAGASLCEIEGMLDIAPGTRKRLMREHPEFLAAIKKGIRLSKAWWLSQGRLHLNAMKFDSTLWYMNMKNRFGWRDRHDFKHGGKIAGDGVTPERAKTLLQEALAERDANTQ